MTVLKKKAVHPLLAHLRIERRHILVVFFRYDSEILRDFAAVSFDQIGNALFHLTSRHFSVNVENLAGALCGPVKEIDLGGHCKSYLKPQHRLAQAGSADK